MYINTMTLGQDTSGGKALNKPLLDNKTILVDHVHLGLFFYF